MRSYPKIPRHDHPVADGFFDEDGPFYVTEKADGSCFRFMLYDSAYRDHYSDTVRNLDVEDGDIVFGTKSIVRGTTQTPLEEIDGNLRRAARHLKTEVDRGAMRDIQAQYGEPFVYFAENMVYHSLDYNYDKSPPPALLGFDIALGGHSAPEPHTGNPYDETFEAFLTLESTIEIFEAINVTPVETLDTVQTYEEAFDPDTFEVPESKWADVTAEGVVVRRHGSDRRAKIVTEEFKELNKEMWGPGEHNAENPNEMFVAMFCPQARIRKMIHKLVQEEDHEFSRSLIEPLRHRVYEDIWAEEWREIKDLDLQFNPSEVKHLVTKRCKNLVMQMETNAKLNDAPADRLWE